MSDLYLRRYHRLIDHYKSGALIEGYTERHHIIPKCMGGSDNNDNMVRLPPRAHFIAHWFLAKHYGGLLWFAFNMMCGNTSCGESRGTLHNKSSRLYARCKAELSEYMREYMTGREVSDSTKHKLSINRSNSVWVTDGNASNWIPFDDVHRFLQDNPTFYLGRDEAYKSIMKRPLPTHFKKGFVYVRDSNNEVRYVSLNDSKDLTPLTLGFVTVGGVGRVTKEEYKNGNYTHHRTGTVVAHRKDDPECKLL